MSEIVVLGSLNLDLVLHMPRMPDDGETLASQSSASFCGGKGANQAVACARMGAAVAMIGRLGGDAPGQTLYNAVAAESIALEGVAVTQGAATGIAVIVLTPGGHNRILLAAGANALLSPADVAANGARIDAAGLLICQLEVPLDTVTAAIVRAAGQGVPVLLNPAPARDLPPTLLAQVDYLIPNESEAALLTGIAVADDRSAEEAALALRAQGVKTVILTRGAAGITIADAQGCRHIPALPANVVDTTAAGDSFIGGFAAGIIEGMDIDAAAHLGLRAASLCVGRAGAQASLPYRRDLPA
jgi:ribokinase